MLQIMWGVLITLALLCGTMVAESALRKLMYQRDLSEYCRRRVIPSVFLGRQVVEAQSQILHFSQLEVPYSCFISIRTEAGSNIIMVVELAADENLEESCKLNNNQMLVYEMRETFGGYWGSLPEAILKDSNIPTQSYILKTNSPTTYSVNTTERDADEPFEITTVQFTPRSTSQLSNEQDFVEIEIPLLNVSVKMVENDSTLEKYLEVDNTFDTIYDVTPRPRKNYETSIVPLVSVKWSSAQPRRSEDSRNQPHYQMDYNFDAFTQDSRLTFPYLVRLSPASRRKTLFKYNANRLLNFKKNKRGEKRNRPFFEANGSPAILKKKLRKRRHINSIPIKHAKPHAMTTRQDSTTTSASYYHFSDMQDFAQFVELQDDKVSGNIPLQYMGKYVGNTLFNICDYKEAKVRHVILLNSSRIVIAINKFTLKRMSVVATAARTLTRPDARCSTDHIECQVSGARVCVDDMTVCDGIPNCGSYDIYDEDRLKCGALKGLQHNVYIAALTFLAVLLTALYAAHYWLKRCVPRVSEAFFIYTDGSENILHLDSIMRSPVDDIDDSPNLVYRSRLFEDDIIGSDICEKKEQRIIYIIKNIFRLCFRKKSNNKSNKLNEGVELECSDLHRPKTRYSFAEMELSKIIGKERPQAAVQTGVSLEIELPKIINKKNNSKDKNIPKILKEKSSDSLTMQHDLPVLKEEFETRQNSQESELNFLKFFRDARSASESGTLCKNSNQTKSLKPKEYDVATGDEVELNSIVYSGSRHGKDNSSGMPVTTNADIHLETARTSTLNKKRLRFDDTPTTIPTVEVVEAENERSRATTFQGRTLNPDILDAIEEDQEQSSGIDFMRFWGSPKVKKNKKKIHK